MRTTSSRRRRRTSAPRRAPGGAGKVWRVGGRRAPTRPGAPVSCNPFVHDLSRLFARLQGGTLGRGQAAKRRGRPAHQVTERNLCASRPAILNSSRSERWCLPLHLVNGPVPRCAAVHPQAVPLPAASTCSAAAAAASRAWRGAAGRRGAHCGASPGIEQPARAGGWKARGQHPRAELGRLSTPRRMRCPAGRCGGQRWADWCFTCVRESRITGRSAPALPA